MSNATFDPVSKPGCLYDYFRGNTDGVNPLALLRDHEPIRPEYRDPDARLAALDEQGLAGVLAVPDARDDLRGAAAPRPRGRVPHVPGLQPLAGRGLGLRPRRPHLRRARTSRSPTRSGPSTSSSGRSARAPALIVMRTAAPTTAVGSPLAVRPDVRPVLGPRERGRHHRRGARRRQRRLVRRLRRRRLRGHVLGRLRAVAQELRHRAGGPRLPAVDGAGQPLHASSRTCGSRRSRTAPSSCPTCSASCGRSTGRCAAGSPTTRSRSSAATSGSTRSGRTTWPRSSSWMGADRVLFGSDWPHIEALPEPLDYLAEAKVLDPAARRRGAVRQRHRADDTAPGLSRRR